MTDDIKQADQDAIDAGHDRTNPSGLPDGHPSKVAQPVDELHHEEGHVDPVESRP